MESNDSLEIPDRGEMIPGDSSERACSLLWETAEPGDADGPAPVKNGGGRLLRRPPVQPPNHDPPTPPPVQSARGSAHQQSDFTATSGHARTDRPTSQVLVCEESDFITVSGHCEF